MGEQIWQRIVETLQGKGEKKGKYQNWFIIVAVIVGIYFMYISAAPKNVLNPAPITGSVDKAGVVSTRTDYREQIEHKLGNDLKTIKGVKDVRVFITLASGAEYEYLENQETTTSTTQEDDGGGGSRIISEERVRTETVMQQNGSGQEAVIVKEKTPQIAGVLVTVKGEGGARLLADITAAVGAALDLPAHRIQVLEMD
ncbi:MAG: hypothetical protein GX922_01045 [Firmicutes bacterium]|nr:hypothetical protein [Bacillota bacterium]